MSDQHPTPPGSGQVPEPPAYSPGQPASPQGQPWPGPGAPGQPEYLQQGTGTPLAGDGGSGGGSARKGLLIGGAVVGTLALAGAGAWAALALSGGGPQPTEALPADTLGFVSIDLDPSAGQKIEAMRMINKFPSLKDELGLDPSDDLREALFDEAFSSGPCEDKTYQDDVAPWLGNRAAVAAVPGDGDAPAPVVVVQVTDADKAEAGLAALAECSSSQDDVAFVVADGWAVVTEDQGTAQAVVDDAAAGSLADDADYQRWMDELGDAGVLNMYVAPGLSDAMAELLGDEAFGMSAADVESFADFQGVAGTVRFNNGALEMEAVGSQSEAMVAGSSAGALVESLPTDTAMAYAASLPEGWLSDREDEIAQSLGGTPGAEDPFGQLSAQLGLELPDDLETLTGEAFALSLGADFDLDAMSSSEDLSGLPLGLKVQGDADAIQEVLDKLSGQLGPLAEVLGSDTAGDVVAVGPSADYREALLDGGGLGDTAAFADAVPDADGSAFVVFVNFDAGGWLDDLAAADPGVADDLEPLSSLGMSATVEDDTTHVLVRLTTD